jgi:hypothetical protein
MRSLVFFVIVSALFMKASTAQQIGFGIKAGGNYSTIEGDWNKLPGPFDTIAQYKAVFEQIAILLDQQVPNLFDFSAENKFGAHAGIFFNIPIIENLSIQPEIIFSMKGANYSKVAELSGSGDSTSYISTNDSIVTYYTGSLKLDYNIKYNLTYIDIPILVKYKFNNGIIITAGPHISILTTSAFKFEGNLTLDLLVYQTNSFNNSNTTVIDTTTTIFIEEIDKSKDDLNTIDVGLIVGIGYEFPFGLGIHARYVTGLTELYNNKEDSGFRNSVIQLGVSYKIFNDLLKFQ